MRRDVVNSAKALSQAWHQLESSVPSDLLDPSLCLDLHPAMHSLRQKDPVHWSPQLNGWVLTRFEDIAAILRDPRVTDASTTGRIDRMPEEERKQLRPLRDSIALWMGHTRKEDHLRFQQFLKKYFSHRTVEQLRHKTQALLDRLIDKLIQDDEIDIVSELAHPLSAGVIAEMLGTPIEDLDQLQRWSRTLNLLFRVRGFQDLLEIQQTLLEMESYLKHFLDARRVERREDLISIFLDGLENGDIASEEEIIANCILLLFAAEDTTASMMSNGMWMLLDHPDQLERLRQEPALIPNAVEEMMRFDGPSTMINRMAVENFELHGRQIEAGQMVFLVLHAGNRDPEVFPEPDQFDVGRKVMKHLAFGYGASYCLGAALARMEAHVFFETVLRRLGDLELTADGAPWVPLPPLWRRLKSLWVRIHPAHTEAQALTGTG
ncbi:cytochrome P450 [Hyalangium versicolor]|uniref:cytochrome P450 n=1 Tax=Hyalangium versicolor TaxID=2861190 RepID=UPI001CCF1C44|nr:cytochrome P450 [Hyalangium versicolor]